MASPTQRRDGVPWAQRRYQVSERRAIRARGVPRSTVRYQSVKPSREPLRARIRELAGLRSSWGYLQIHTLMRREGWPVNHKLVYRLYREEGLVIRRERPKRRRAAVRRERPVVQADRPNERWAMDFMHDTLSGGGSIRVLAVLDVFTRECVALVPGRRFRRDDVAAILSEVGAARASLPSVISVDNGTELTSKSPDHWAYWNRVSSTSVGRASRRTTPTSRPPTHRCDVSACRNTGSSTSRTPGACLIDGGPTTTTSDPTGAWPVLRRPTSRPALFTPRARKSSKCCPEIR